MAYNGHGVAPAPAAVAAKGSRQNGHRQPAKEDSAVWDCIVVGGGPAGLSAALILGRARRRVLIFDSGEKRNEASLIQHAILGADGFNRSHFLEGARKQVLAYPTLRFRCLAVCDINIKAAEVEQGGGSGSGEVKDCGIGGEVKGDGGGWEEGRGGDGGTCTLTDGRRITATDRFVVHTADGRQWRSKKVILATGVRDLLPDIDGFETYWGRGIWVCLYCDAFEYSGQPLGAYGNGERGVHIAFEMLLWSRDVVLFTDGEPLEATDLERKLLDQEGVRVIETPIARAVGDGDGELAGLVLQDGCIVPLKALFFNTGRVQSSKLPEKMHLPVDDRGDIKCEIKGNVQAVHGLFVAGNCAASPLKLVMTAASQGAVTGAKVNSELLYEDLGLDKEVGERYICSLTTDPTSVAVCKHVYSGGGSGQQRSALTPTLGAPVEEIRAQLEKAASEQLEKTASKQLEEGAVV